MTPSRVARTIIAVYCVLAVWFPLQGYLVSDDYQIQTRAYLAEWLAPDFLFQPWGGHLMPGGFAVAQVLAKTVPFAYVPMALLITAGLIAAAWITYGLLRDLVGDRWPLAIATSAYVACAGTWQAATWWTASLNAVPFLVAMPLALRWHLKWVRGGRALWAVAALGVVALGLVFFEKALLLILVLAAFTVAMGAPEVGFWRATGRALSRGWWLWPGYLILIGVTVVAYLASDTASVATPDPAAADFMDALYLGGITYPVVVTGGPWVWSPGGLAEPPWVLAVLSIQVVAGLALVQCLRSSVGRRLWSLVGLYLIAVIASVAIGRLVWGPGIITQPRYFLDAAVLTIIVAAAAWGYTAQRNSPAPASRRRRRWQAAGVIVSINVLLAGMVTSIVALSQHMSSEPGRLWVRTALASLADSQDAVLESTVPPEVTWELAYPDTRYSRFFAPVQPPERFPEVETSLNVLGPTGVLGPGQVLGDPLPPGPAPDCGWLLASGGGTIELPVTLVDFRHTFRLEYLAGANATADIALTEGPATPVEFRQGLRVMYVWLQGGGSTIEVTDLTEDVVVCVSDITVGPTAPAEGLSP